MSLFSLKVLTKFSLYGIIISENNYIFRQEINARNRGKKMTVLTQHQSYGEIIYKESFWTGKKSLTINGVDAQPVSKKEFVLEEKRIIIKSFGNP